MFKIKVHRFTLSLSTFMNFLISWIFLIGRFLVLWVLLVSTHVDQDQTLWIRLNWQLYVLKQISWKKLKEQNKWIQKLNDNIYIKNYFKC